MILRKYILLALLCLGVNILWAQDIRENMVYRVTAHKNGDTSITSMSNYAEIIPPLHLYIPSAFSPNGDGINDTFGVKGEGIKNYHLLVYNRWGELLFESTNPKQQWDGKFDGQRVEQGTYVYQLYALGEGNKGKSGSVTLIY
jgi:gliding motility-associated-like protein